MSLRSVSVLVAASLSLAAAVPAALAADTVTAQQARAAIAPFYQALNAGTDAVALIHQATGPQWVSCSDDDDCKPRDKAAPNIAGFHKAVPDLKWEIKEVLVAGNRVTVRGEASGTPAGSFMGVAHGGKRFKIMSIDIHTLEAGKIVRSYHIEDWMGAVRQLSAK